MSYALNNITTANGYTPANTLQDLPSSSKVNGQIANAAVYVQVQRRWGSNVGPGYWDPEVFLTPQKFNWARFGLCGVRVRSAVPGAPGQATLEIA